MRHLWIRLGLLVVAFHAVSLMVVLLVGQRIQTEAVTDYLTYEDHAYTLMIRDSRRDLRLNLAGKRCFDPLPIWAKEQDGEFSDDYFGQFYQRWDELAVDAVIRLRC
jgi:hypothetical protein